MTVFELLDITPGDSIKVNNPRSNSGSRDVVPLSLSRNGISIRAIDCRHGDICYVGSEWTILMSNQSVITLQTIPYIRNKLDEWHLNKLKNQKPLIHDKGQFKIEKIEREFPTFNEVLSTIHLNNQKVAITGTLPLSRVKAKYLLESKGAIVVSVVSSRTSFLFMGDTGRHEVTSKMKMAHKFGVKIITF